MDDLFHHKSRDEGYCRMTWSTLGRKTAFFGGFSFRIVVEQTILRVSGWVQMTHIFGMG